MTLHSGRGTFEKLRMSFISKRTFPLDTVKRVSVDRCDEEIWAVMGMRPTTIEGVAAQLVLVVAMLVVKVHRGLHGIKQLICNFIYTDVL